MNNLPKLFISIGDLEISIIAGQNNDQNSLEILDKLILPIDSIISDKFEKKIRHKNYIFSNGIDLIHEFFNFERKINSKFLIKSVKALGKNPSINKIFTEIAGKGFLY